MAAHPSVCFGAKGMAVSGWWMNGTRLFPETFMQEVGKPQSVLPRVPNGHEADFLDAIRKGRRSSADFDCSARLAEIMLVGNAALLVRGNLAHDFRTGRFANSETANALLKRDTRRPGSSGTRRRPSPLPSGVGS